MKNLMVRFLKDESGATAIQYGLIAAGISVVIIATVNSYFEHNKIKQRPINGLPRADFPTG